MMVGAKVCELTDGFLWFVCGLYVGILTSPLIGVPIVTNIAHSKSMGVFQTPYKFLVCASKCVTLQYF